MANPKQRCNKSEEGFLNQADILLKKKVLLNKLTEEDTICIKSFVSEIAITNNLSGARRYNLTSILANSRKWLKTPFRKMTTSDLFMTIDAIQNDTGLDQNSIRDYVRSLKQISLWLLDNEMASPGLKVEKVNKIALPVFITDNFEICEPDLKTDITPRINNRSIESSDINAQNYEMTFLVTVAKIFHKNKKYDLAKAIAEYCINDPRHQKTCLDILMRCAYYQKNFPKSLEYVDKLIDIDPMNSKYPAYKRQILPLTQVTIEEELERKKKQMEVFYFTHNGGVRTLNEDSLLISQEVIAECSMESPEIFRTDYSDSIFCVADGIGGEQRGEVASSMVLSGIRDYQDAITDNATLSGTLFLVKKLLDTYALENPEASNLGSTLSGICFRGETGIAFNVGDCRVYRINEGKFEKITKDHSLVQSLYDEGIIREDEMRHHPKKNIVTSSISGDGLPDSIRLFSTTVDLQSDDIFFICSDGIWECFSHDELEMIYQKFQGFTYCEKILTAALARKASDNISAILIQIS